VAGDGRPVLLKEAQLSRLIPFGLVALVSVTIAVGVGYWVGSRPTIPEVLAPATVPPKVGLCSEQLLIRADGSVSPMFCSKGEINRFAWQHFAQSYSRVMGLGPSASPYDVVQALLAERHGLDDRNECSAYQLAAVYYGWSFGNVDPTGVAIDNGCSVVR